MGLLDIIRPGGPLTAPTGIMGLTLPDWAQGLLGSLPQIPGLSGVSDVFNQVVNNNPISQALTAATSPTQQGPGSGLVPANPDGTDRNYASIRQKMISTLGFAPRRKTVNFMLRRMGADFTETALGIDQNDVLWLLTHKRTSSRRHYVETYMKWCRRGDGARKKLAHFASKCGGRRASSGGHRRKKAAPPAVRIVKVPAAR